MKIYMFFFVVIFLCNCTEKEIVYPEGDIKEIRIYGVYKPKDPQRLENRINKFIKGGRIKNRKEFKERYPHYLDLGDESFEKSPDIYCYDRTLAKMPVFNKNLIVRAYDRDKNLLLEDYIRVNNVDEKNNSFSIISYIPYDPKIYFIYIVRLEGKKEVVFWDSRGKQVKSKAELIHLSKPLPYDVKNEFEYHSKTRCHYDTFGQFK